MSLVIKHGHVIDPASGRSEVIDVRIADGRIAEFGPDLEGDEVRPLTPNVVDAPVYSAVGSAQACNVIDVDILRNPKRFQAWIGEGKRRGDRKCLNVFGIVELDHPAEEIDIDTPADLELAEEVLRNGWFDE